MFSLGSHTGVCRNLKKTMKNYTAQSFHVIFCCVRVFYFPGQAATVEVVATMATTFFLKEQRQTCSILILETELLCCQMTKILYSYGNN